MPICLLLSGHRDSTGSSYEGTFGDKQTIHGSSQLQPAQAPGVCERMISTMKASAHNTCRSLKPKLLLSIEDTHSLTGNRNVAGDEA